MCLTVSVNLKNADSQEAITVFKVMKKLCRYPSGVDGTMIRLENLFYHTHRTYHMKDCIIAEGKLAIQDVNKKGYPPGIHCFLTLDDAEVYLRVMSATTKNLTIIQGSVEQKDIVAFGTSTIWDGVTKIWNSREKEWFDVSQNLLTVVVQKMQILCEPPLAF